MELVLYRPPTVVGLVTSWRICWIGHVVKLGGNEKWLQTVGGEMAT